MEKKKIFKNQNVCVRVVFELTILVAGAHNHSHITTDALANGSLRKTFNNSQ